MSSDMTGKIHGLIQRAKKLRANSVFLYNSPIYPRLNWVDEAALQTLFKIYNSIRNDIIKSFKSDTMVQSLPFLSFSNNNRAQIHRLVAGLDQFIAFLEGKQIDVLGTRVRKFPVQDSELNILPSTTKLLLLEAIGEYDFGHSYACCCICGLAFESLAKEGCKKNNLPYKTLAEAIKTLKEAKVIKEDMHKSLADLEKYYRDKISAHLTSETATNEKARLFLSSLLELAKAVFEG